MVSWRWTRLCCLVVVYHSHLRASVTWYLLFDRNSLLGPFQSPEFQSADAHEPPVVRCPSLSSVLYLSSKESGGGPTVVIRSVLAFDVVAGSLWQSSRFSPVLQPAEPAEAAVVYPERGRYLTFDGNLLHGVLHPVLAGIADNSEECDSDSSQNRVTLLVNYWLEEAPLPPYCVPLTKKEASAMARASGWTLEGDRDRDGGEDENEVEAPIAKERPLGAADLVTDGLESQGVTVQVSLPTGDAELVELLLPEGEKLREYDATWVNEMDVQGKFKRFLD